MSGSTMAQVQHLAVLIDVGHARQFSFITVCIRVPSGSLARASKNLERFWLGGAAHKWRHECAVAGAAPVSEKRVGLKRLRRTPMGIVVAFP